MSSDDPTHPPGNVRAGFTTEPGIPVAKLRPAITELAKAYRLAALARRSPWEFAIPRGTLRRLGLTDTDLRWLACRGYVLGAREVTQLEDEVRSFRPCRNLAFGRRSCFVLTETGNAFARAVGELIPAQASAPAGASIASTLHPDCAEPVAKVLRPVPPTEVPEWDAARRELRYRGLVVKRYRVPAHNQELVLSVFQEEGWPQYIDDPLPPCGDQDPKHRLQATIKSLNRNQQHAVIRFHGNGNGLQVYWEASDAD